MEQNLGDPFDIFASEAYPRGVVQKTVKRSSLGPAMSSEPGLDTGEAFPQVESLGELEKLLSEKCRSPKAHKHIWLKEEEPQFWNIPSLERPCSSSGFEEGLQEPHLPVMGGVRAPILAQCLTISQSPVFPGLRPISGP